MFFSLHGRERFRENVLTELSVTALAGITVESAALAERLLALYSPVPMFGDWWEMVLLIPRGYAVSHQYMPFYNLESAMHLWSIMPKYNISAQHALTGTPEVQCSFWCCIREDLPQWFLEIRQAIILQHAIGEMHNEGWPQRDTFCQY